MSPKVGPIQVYPREGDPRQTGASQQAYAAAGITQAPARPLLVGARRDTTTGAHPGWDKADGEVPAGADRSGS